MSTQLSYYELLDLPTTASPDEIRSSFYAKCRRLHPDKNTQSSFSDEQWSEWSAIQVAYKTLSNKTRRLIYDIRLENRPFTDEECEAVIAMEKDQAIQDIKNMKFEYETSLEREKSKNGIVIISALYGDLAGTRDKENDNGQIAGTGGVVDVQIPLQCSVDNHKLIISSGTVKADIPGFYNPIRINQKSAKKCYLYVLYEFKGIRHEVTVSDNEAVWLPLKAHALSRATEPKGPSISPAEKPRTSLNLSGIAYGTARLTVVGLLTFWFVKKLVNGREIGLKNLDS
jgi:Domain of unknown function (DUF3395)/DnaJ domain